MSRRRSPNREPPAASAWTAAALAGVAALAVFSPQAGAEAAGAEARPSDLSPGFIHQHWTVDDGLPVNALNDVVQTADGWLWLGTFDGLLRFDGAAFTRFDTVVAPALRSNRIVQLLADRDGSLWSLSEQGHLTRTSGSRFHAVETPEDDSPRVLQMTFDGAGTLWLATPRGLYRAHDDRLLAGPGGPEPINAVGSGTSGRVWLATDDNRLAVFAGGQLSWVAAGMERYPRDFVQYLAEDNDGTRWIGTDDGLFRWPDGKPTERLDDLAALRGVLAAGPLPMPAAAFAGRRRPAVTWEVGRSIRFLEQGPRGGLWESDGTTLLHDGRRVLALPPDSRPGIRALAFDHEGTAWIATGSQGLHALRLARVATLGETGGLAGSNVYPIHQDRRGTIWIGDATGGLTRVAGGKVEAIAEDETATVMSIYDDPGSGLLLIGASGLQRVAGGRRIPLEDVSASPDRPRLDSGSIRAMLRLRDGRLLVGHERGLWVSRDGDPRHDGWRFHRLEESAEWRIRALLEDEAGNVWLGTNGAGVIRWRDGRFTAVTTAEGLSSDLVRALHRDAGGGLWIATEDRGLNRLDLESLDSGPRPEIAVIQKRDGLWDDSLHKVLEDAGGWFWISTNRGVFRVRRAQLEAFAAGHVPRVDSVAYTEADGMRHREANGGLQDSGLRARDGRLWFPTQDGVAIFDPRALVRLGTPPPVHVERLRAGGHEIGTAGGAVTLEPHQRSFEITYTALAFRAPERVRFRYRLGGFQQAWTEADGRRQAIFTKVPAGRYAFQVQARSGDGVWNREGARLAVVVRPFPWETWWARGAAVLVLALAAYGGMRLRDRRQRARQRYLESEVARLMAECDGCRLTVELTRERDSAAREAEKLAELERLKSELFADVSHELRTPLTLTLGPLRDLSSGTCGELPAAARQQVEVAGRSAERMLGFVDEILDTARLESGQLALKVRPGDLTAFLADLAGRFHGLAERRGVRFRFRPPPGPIPMWGDPGQLEKVFANLLSNAMRYTPEGGLVIMTAEPREAAGTVAVTVRDEGPGIAAGDQERIFDRFSRVTRPAIRGDGGIGLGLPLARRLTELHGGSLTLDSAPDKGSAFRVELRLGRDHFPASQIIEDQPWRTWTGAGGAIPEELADRGPDADASGARPASPALNRHPDAEEAEDRATVLVVDDHPGIRTFVRRHLEPRYRVAEAADGAEGLDLARELVPDLVVSDVMMPEMDGRALCRALKQDPELDWLPVVLLTKQAAADDKLAGLGEGADDYLTKPFDARELAARVDNLIASRRRLKERYGSSGGMPRPRLPLAPGMRATAGDLEWLKRVREAVEAGFEEQALSVDALAERLAVHRSRLHERLRQLTGRTPLQLITDLRLERAAALLERQATSVSEAAYAVGYDSVSHFSRRFKKRYGKSPSAWRRSGAG